MGRWRDEGSGEGGQEGERGRLDFGQCWDVELLAKIEKKKQKEKKRGVTISDVRVSGFMEEVAEGLRKGGGEAGEEEGRRG